MQPQFILASLLAGLAAAIGTSAREEPAAVDALPGGPGGRTFCIGVKGENFGVAKECAPAFCLGNCDYAKDDNGCAICGPDCE
ncbi:hypothetical protein G3M48_008193 [Beauveria asiatica]|uniref:Uncharacterized protein n=1 Tax=Beauveria asiatica TaxID=1069075 RepID=A0AAW0RL79_9HYPO